jgi:hypothetical protein
MINGQNAGGFKAFRAGFDHVQMNLITAAMSTAPGPLDFFLAGISESCL